MYFKVKINRELLKSKVFNLDHQQPNQGRKHRIKPTASAKARSLMNLHNNEAGRRVSLLYMFYLRPKFKSKANILPFVKRNFFLEQKHFSLHSLHCLFIYDNLFPS